VVIKLLLGEIGRICGDKYPEYQGLTVRARETGENEKRGNRRNRIESVLLNGPNETKPRDERVFRFATQFHTQL